MLVASPASLFGPASSIDAIEKAARDAGYFVTVAHAASLDPAAIEAALEQLSAQAVDGIVVVAPQQRIQDAMDAMSVRVPSITLHGAGTAADHGVFVDQLEGARLATRHLLAAGHTRIAHLSGPGDWSEARARREGFLQEMEAAGADPVVSRDGDWTAASGAEIGAELLADATITAVFSSNDQMALGAMFAAQRAGRRVPEDVAVVGFDDIPEAAYLLPPLTTVRQDFRELGRRCVARLVAEIEGSELDFGAPVAPVLVRRDSA